MPDDITLKMCTKCERELSLADFSRDARLKSGLRSWCKECAAAYLVDYRLAHKQTLAEQGRSYRAANRERIAIAQRVRALARAEELAAYYRRYREIHKDRIRETRHKHYEANKEQLLAQSAEYRRAHLGQEAESNRQWRKSHPGEVAARLRNYRSRKAGNGGTHTAEDIQAQYDRQGGKCFYCREKLDKYHVDHVTPVSQGGSNGPENLVVSCPPCNLRKGAKHPMDWAGRLL